MRKTKKVLSLFLSICLAFSLVSGVMVSASAASARNTKLDLTTASSTENTQQGWAWNSSSRVFEINGIDFNVIDGSAVILPAGSTISVTGTNKISTNMDGTSGIYCNGALTITGTGSLDINAAYVAVYAKSDITVVLSSLSAIGSTGGVHANGGNANLTTTGSLTAGGSSFAISSTKNVSVNAGTSLYAYNYASDAGPAIWSYGNITLASASIAVVADSSSKGDISNLEYDGVITLAGGIPSGQSVEAFGDVQVTGALTVTGRLTVDGNISVSSGAALGVVGTVSAINGGTITAAPGTISVNGSISPSPCFVSITKLFVNGVDLLTDADRTITAGSGKASYSAATNTLTLSSATVTSAAVDNDTFRCGIFADGSLTIKLEGTNTVSASFDRGINIDGGSLSIKGSGTLYASGAEAGIMVQDGALSLSGSVHAVSVGSDSAAILVLQGSGTAAPWISLASGMSSSPYSVAYVDVGLGRSACTFAASSLSYSAKGYDGAARDITIGSGMKVTNNNNVTIPMLTVGTPMTAIDLSDCASGGSGAYTYSASGLPAGLKMTSSGVIMGTPTAVASTGKATITAKDEAGYTASMELPFEGVINVSVSGSITTLTVGAEFAASTRSGALSSTYLSKALAIAPSTTTLELIVNVDGTDSIKSESVSVPIAALKDIQQTLALTAVCDNGAVSLDTAALKSVLGNNTSGNLTFTVSPLTAANLNAAQKTALGSNFGAAEIRNISITSAGNTVSAIASGKAMILVPYKYKDATAYTLSSSGTLASIASSYSSSSSCAVFYTTAPGIFVVNYSASTDWKNPFTDVKSGTWYFDGVWYNVTVTELFKGTSNTTFSPAMTMNMAQLLQVLYRVAGNKDTTSTSGNWWDAAEAWAIKQGLVTAANFKSTAAVTREDFICMFYKTVAALGTYDMTKTADITKATDYSTLNSSSRTAIAWAVGTGLIVGTDGSTLTISPNVQVNRATVCTMLMRYYQGL